MNDNRYICPLEKIHITKAMRVKHIALGCFVAFLLSAALFKSIFERTGFSASRVELILCLFLGGIVGVLVGDSFIREKNIYIRNIQKVYEAFNRDRVCFDENGQRELDLMVRSIDYIFGGPSIRK